MAIRNFNTCESDTELPEHVLQWALDTLKVAIHHNLEGARKHYATYGIYDTNIISLFVIKKCHFIFTRILSDIWWSGSVMKDQREQEVSIGMASDSHGSNPRNLNSVIQSKG